MRSGRREALAVTTVAASGVLLSHVLGHRTETPASAHSVAMPSMSMPARAAQHATWSWAQAAPAPRSLWTLLAVVVLAAAVARSVRQGARRDDHPVSSRRLLGSFGVLVAVQVACCLAVRVVDGHEHGVAIGDVVWGPSARVALAVQVVVAAVVSVILFAARRVGATLAACRRVHTSTRRRLRVASSVVLVVRPTRAFDGRAPPLRGA